MRTQFRSLLVALVSFTIIGAGFSQPAFASTTWEEKGGSLSDTQFTLIGNHTGEKLFASTWSGLNTSNDGGATWISHGIDGYVDGWGKVAGSADLQTLYASNVQSILVRSLDGGTTWSLMTGFTGTPEIQGVSSDGTMITVSGSEGHTWLSRNSGTTFTQLTATQVAYSKVFPSPNKKLLFAVTGTGGGADVERNLLASKDFGVTWLTYKNLGTDIDVTTWAISADNSSIALATTLRDGTGPAVYITHDNGSHWGLFPIPPEILTTPIYNLQISTDGERLALQSNSVVMRTDFNNAWTQIDGLEGYAIHGMAFSASGNRMNVLRQNSHVYMTEFPVSPDRVTNVRITQRTPTTATIGWDIPAQNGAELFGFTIKGGCNIGLSQISQTVNSPTVHSLTITGIRPGATCAFGVTAENANFTSADSLYAWTGLPTRVGIAAPKFKAAKTAVITWGISNGNGTAIVKYEYCMSTCSKKASWHSTGLKKWVTLKNLKKRSRYTIQVRANNGAGNSPVASRTFIQAK